MHLSENDELLGTAENLTEGEATYPLTLNSELIMPEETENATEYTVTIQTDGNGVVSSGLISGMTSNTFAPKDNATRAQVASLIKRLLAK